MKKIHNKLQSVFQSRDFHERLVLMILALAFIASVIGMGRVALGARLSVLFMLLTMCIVSGIVLWLVYKKHKTKLASWLLILIFNVVLFPFVFIMSSGIDSGTPIWLVLELTYIFLLFRGKECAMALVISILSFFATYWVAYRYPDLVPVVTNRYYRYIDSCVTLVVVSCCIGVLLKIQTISYERERENVLKQQEEMEQIARSKDVFFANMSHEIRTPINTIIGLNEMTLRENISDEIAENAINIQNASKMLLTTINDILDLSKLESGKMDIVPVQYEVSAMFSDLVNLIWLRANQKDLEFRVDIAQDIPSMLYGDEVRIKQVITNLLTNAVKYTRAGSVTLTAKGERLSADSFRLRISVADTGTGIRKESLDDLFNSFKRVDEELNRNIEGTGLGLNISKQLMDMMGGKISVDSVYHKGSVFTIELEQGIVNVNPIGMIDFAAQKKLSNRQAYEESFVAPDARVLVVDDNDMNRMVVKKLLRGTEVQVDTVSGGWECLKKTAEGFYHVILMDHMMPEMDGEETLHAVREQTKGYCQNVPIIALTANVMTNAEQIYQEMGFDGYLAKPINAVLLEAALLKYLPQDVVEYVAEENADASDDMGISQVTSARKRKIAITADCICDLPEEWLRKLDISLMYCYVHTKEGRFCDITEIYSDSLLDYLKIEGNYAHSSTAPPAEYEYFFADALEKAEHVIHITASTDLSGAYPYALQASKSFDNVTVFDSQHISSGYGLMVLFAAVMAENGKGAEEICDSLKELRNRICSNFLVPSTETLCRNGKVSTIVDKLCRGLNLHPVLYMSQNKLKLWKIEVGNMQRVNRNYVKQLLHHSKDIDSRLLFLTYAGCSVRQLDEIIAEVDRYIKFDQIILQKASATVSSNCGVGTYGLMFFRKTEEDIMKH